MEANMEDATPVLIEEEEATTPLPRMTMAELVYGDEEPVPVCRICEERGTVHVPEDEL